MGNYLNPGNEEFREIKNSNYVDKTGLIEFINTTLFTTDKLTCFSRPRRFGKSFAAKMLCAYYDKSCDSKELFQDLIIAEKSTFEKYLNQFNVIYLDITWFITLSENIENVVSFMQQSVIEELREDFPDCIKVDEKSLPLALLNISKKTDIRFIVIIDEWDALFREVKSNEKVQKEYIQLLRALFKAGNTAKMIAGAYMTGILPIKKYGTESALTDFREYTMTQPAKLAQYVGFTEPEVKQLCINQGLDMEEARQWYDGYSFKNLTHIYSPNSVMSALRNETFENYWTKTESYESLKGYISMNFDGLQDSIITMLGGERVKVDTLSFQNDITSLENKDDVLTLLIHLGYLGYDSETREVYIPNLEVADSFKIAVSGERWKEVQQMLTNSERLLEATIQGNESYVAEVVEKIHETTASILTYNDENALSCAIMIAYFTARKDYTIIRELPTGKGFADLVFVPRRNIKKPAIIIELKYDKSANTAMNQIKEKRYHGVLEEYEDNLLMVGINYNKTTKKHECKIEKLRL